MSSYAMDNAQSGDQNPNQLMYMAYFNNIVEFGTSVGRKIY